MWKQRQGGEQGDRQVISGEPYIQGPRFSTYQNRIPSHTWISDKQQTIFSESMSWTIKSPSPKLLFTWNSNAAGHPVFYWTILFSSVTQLCQTLSDPMACSMPGLPVHHQLPEFTQTYVHWVGDATQPSHPLSSPSPPAFSLSQHQGLSSESVLCIRWPKYCSFSFNISPSNEHSGMISFRMDWLDLLAVQGTLKSLFQHHSSKAAILLYSAFFIAQLSHPYMTSGSDLNSDLSTKQVMKTWSSSPRWKNIQVSTRHLLNDPQALLNKSKTELLSYPGKKSCPYGFFYLLPKSSSWANG